MLSELSHCSDMLMNSRFLYSSYDGGRGGGRAETVAGGDGLGGVMLYYLAILRLVVLRLKPLVVDKAQINPSRRPSLSFITATQAHHRQISDPYQTNPTPLSHGPCPPHHSSRNTCPTASPADNNPPSQTLPPSPPAADAQPPPAPP